MAGMIRSLGIIVVVVMVIASFSVFTVDEREKAIKFQLGEIVKTDFEPGIHLKMPLVNNIRKFDSRILTMDAPPEKYLTIEKKNLKVDSFVKWRIADVASYYRAMGGDERNAAQRISQIIKDQLRNEFGKRTIQEAVSGERNQIMDSLVVNTRRQVEPFGIEIVDVRIKRIDYDEEISDSIYNRMRAERARVAKDFRSRGEEEAERVRADADRQREIILAEAYRDAETIRGEGDAVAANTYAKAYNRDKEFYAFYRSLNAYRTAFKDKNDIVLMQPDGDFFKYFDSQSSK